MRSKEYSHDYRYFPDPDLVPIAVSDAYIESIAATMPELPRAKRIRFQNEYNLPEYDAGVLTESPQLADYFEQTARLCNNKKMVSNWVMGQVLRSVKELGGDFGRLKVTPAFLAELLALLENQKISANSAKTIFDECLKTGKAPTAIVEDKGLAQVSDAGEIQGVIEQVLAGNPKDVQDYLAGKDKVMGFLMGQAMRATKGKADPKVVNRLLRSKLAELKK